MFLKFGVLINQLLVFKNIELLLTNYVILQAVLMHCKKDVTKFDVLSLQKVSQLTTVKIALSYNTNSENYATYGRITVQNFT